MINRMTIESFRDELCKIAEGDAVPLVRWLPKDPDKALHRIRNHIDRSTKEILGHKNVAVRAKKLGDLEQLGFKKTRMSVPLPGERMGTHSWRKGDLHAHLLGEHYLMHRDRTEPKGVLRSAIHVVKEGIPAAVRRIRNRKEIEVSR